MKKQLKRAVKIDNGMKNLIERHPGLLNGYILGTTEHLEKIPGAKVYTRSQIKRVVNDEVGLNYRNRVIKIAFMAYYAELIPPKASDRPANINYTTEAMPV